MRLLALLCLAGLAGAQTPKSGPARRTPQPIAPAFYPIEALAVEGNQLYTPEQILAASGLRPGLPGGQSQFDAARDRLLATGYFQSVGFRFESAPGGNTYLGSFQVVEVQPVYHWRIEEIPVERTDFERIARQRNPMFGQAIPATEQVLSQNAQLLQAMASNKQGSEFRVVAKMVPDGPGEPVIVFRPAAPPPNIAEVRFDGNSKIDSATLIRAISPIAVGSPWSEPRFREYLQTTIVPMYESVGHLRVSFGQVTTAPSPTVKGIIVTVPVKEGDAYKLTNFEIGGTALSPSQLQEEAQIKTGDTVNVSELGLGMERVMKKLRSLGYLNTSYKAQRRIHDIDKTVEIFATISPGNQYIFRNLEIVGLDIQSEPVIRKLWAQKQGEPFNAGYPDYFLERVRTDGLFDNLGKTKAEVKKDDKAMQVDVVLTFSGDAPPKRKKGS